MGGAKAGDGGAALRLRVREPDDDEEGAFLLTGADAAVGRDAACDVLLVDASVSGRHGLLRATGAGYVYTDLGSSNGSALMRGGAGEAVILRAGEPAPLGPGDVLLLGAADRPVRIVVETGAAPYASGPAAERTIVASRPLADLSRRDGAGGADALVRLAGLALAAESAEALAEAALVFMRAVAPRAERAGVAVWAAGMGASAGDVIPGGVREAALEAGEVVLFESPGEALPLTRSVAASGLRAALAAPLTAHGAAHGVLAAWSAVGAVALPRAAMGPLSVAASVLALAAARLGTRAAGEARRRMLEAEVRELTGQGAARPVLAAIGESAPFVRAVDLARSVAPSDVPLLVLGETGTGKEVVARNVHAWSRRAAKPFVAFNCAAVPESLIESELFGHARGAFTGASGERRGLFEEADGGTIFLDEIGEMPAVMQAKLLRVLQDGEVRRVGATRAARVDVRVVSATHRDLPELVAAGTFRADLMYRLNAVSLRLPPLRERGDDVALLAHFLLGRACHAASKEIPGFSAEALWALGQYGWPGNVRELENEVMRAVALTPPGQAIGVSVFSDRVADAAPDVAAGAGGGGARTFKEAVADAERAIVERALAAAEGNVSQAARDLGLTRPGLYKVMERLALR